MVLIAYMLLFVPMDAPLRFDFKDVERRTGAKNAFTIIAPYEPHGTGELTISLVSDSQNFKLLSMLCGL